MSLSPSFNLFDGEIFQTQAQVGRIGSVVDNCDATVRKPEARNAHSRAFCVREPPCRHARNWTLNCFYQPIRRVMLEVLAMPPESDARLAEQLREKKRIVRYQSRSLFNDDEIALARKIQDRLPDKKAIANSKEPVGTVLSPLEFSRIPARGLIRCLIAVDDASLHPVGGEPV